MTLAERIVELNRLLARRRIPRAFGGAIALAYWTRDPRGTSDIDLNLFVPAVGAERALRALPEAVEQPSGTVDAIGRDGQVRLWWEGVPLDLFFDALPIHADAARNRRLVSFGGARIPVLGPVELAVFKVMFDRTRDWADVESMIAARTLDLDATRAALLTLLDADDRRFARLEAAEQVATPEEA